MFLGPWHEMKKT